MFEEHAGNYYALAFGESSNIESPCLLDAMFIHIFASQVPFREAIFLSWEK